MADVPRWASRTTLPLALVGLGLSVYLTWEHYTAGSTLSCPNTGAISCLKVTTSAQSMFAGVPVALLGAIWFAGMAALCLPQVWASDNRTIARLRLAGATAGVVGVVYLVAVEFLVVRALCLWCTAVHVVALAMFVAVLSAFLLTQPLDHRRVQSLRA